MVDIFIIIGVLVLIGLLVTFKVLQKKASLNKEDEIEKRILLLDKNLKSEEELKLYIELNRINLPTEKEWDLLLPNMIKEFLNIGWNTEMKIYTKITYGSYRIEVSTEDEEIKIKANNIISKYIEDFETRNL